MPRPWLPLYPADYLADTRDLDATGHGVYLLLLMESWHRGPLADVDAKLTCWSCGAPLALVRQVLADYWVLGPDGWTNPRLEEERAKTETVYQARKAAVERWNSRRKAAVTETVTETVTAAVTETVSAPQPQPQPQPQKNSKTPPSPDGDGAPQGGSRVPPGSKKLFKPPTLEEVAAYCRERDRGIDPQAWMDHYTANGWKVGRNAMKDWRAAVRTWERQHAERERGNGGQPPRNRTDHVLDLLRKAGERGRADPVPDAGTPVRAPLDGELADERDGAGGDAGDVGGGPGRAYRRGASPGHGGAGAPGGPVATEPARASRPLPLTGGGLPSAVPGPAETAAGSGWWDGDFSGVTGEAEWTH